MNGFSNAGANDLLERSVTGLHDSLAVRISSLVDASTPMLDVGCGSGAWLERLSRYGFNDAVGIDRDIEQIRSKCGAYKLVDLDHMGKWPFTDGSFGLITSIEVIEHISNIGHFLEESARLLASDGVLLLTTPNVLSLAARLKYLLRGDLKQFDCFGDQTHLFPIILDTFPRVLDRYGLQLVESWGYPNTGETLTSRRTTNIVMKILRIFLPERIRGDVLCMLVRHTDNL